MRNLFNIFDQIERNELKALLINLFYNNNLATNLTENCQLINNIDRVRNVKIKFSRISYHVFKL